MKKDMAHVTHTFDSHTLRLKLKKVAEKSRLNIYKLE